MHIICSGIPYSSLNGFCWTDYPVWKQKFEEVLIDVNRPLFLGGNIHSNKVAGHAFRKVIVEDPLIQPLRQDHIFKPPDFTVKVNHLFEVISSGVGHPFNYDNHTSEDMEVDEGPPNPEIPANLSCNNYGLIDITSEQVIIQLYGTKPKDNHLLTINKENWTIEDYQSMVSGVPQWNTP